MGGAGLGKTHLATALAYQGCLAGHTVLFTTAIDIVNTLTAAQSTHRLKAELKKYLSPSIVLVDELGYLPIDKTGADLLFQVFSQRYETRSTIVTTNQAYKNWAKVFNNDAIQSRQLADALPQSLQVQMRITAMDLWRFVAGQSQDPVGGDSG
jgi:DNA replication protein DnaC